MFLPSNIFRQKSVPLFLSPVFLKGTSVSEIKQKIFFPLVYISCFFFSFTLEAAGFYSELVRVLRSGWGWPAVPPVLSPDRSLCATIFGPLAQVSQPERGKGKDRQEATERWLLTSIITCMLSCSQKTVMCFSAINSYSHTSKHVNTYCNFPLSFNQTCCII